MLVLPVLLYACETWTVLFADERRLEAFHMKCQRQITKIRWQDHIRNSEVAARTGLGPVSDLITRHRNSVFGHISRLSEDTPAHQALRCHVDLTLGHLPDRRWKRRAGRPNNWWIDQLCRNNNNTPPADLWRRSTTCGHSGVTLRSSTTTRWRRWHFAVESLLMWNSLPDNLCVTQHWVSTCLGISWRHFLWSIDKMYSLLSAL